MTDRIQKVLRKLLPKEQKVLEELLSLIVQRKIQGLDLKKLRGNEHIFRVRKGTMRIIFRNIKDQVEILAVERRNDTIYKEF